jgi:hypothetical protein
MATLRVETNVEKSWIQGRNGLFNITAIQIWGPGDVLYVDGIGKRGFAIKGGLCVNIGAFDNLAIQWLESRGYHVTKEACDESPAA